MNILPEIIVFIWLIPVVLQIILPLCILIASLVIRSVTTTTKAKTAEQMGLNQAPAGSS